MLSHILGLNVRGEAGAKKLNFTLKQAMKTRVGGGVKV